MSYIYMERLVLMFVDHTQRRTTVGRTPLDEWSARRRDVYLTTHDTHNRQKSMPPVGFEPTISAGERPQTYALDRMTTTSYHTYNHKTAARTVLHVRESNNARLISVNNQRSLNKYPLKHL